MAVNIYGVREIKSELKHLSSAQLAELCLRIARYKKENKELLSYLLFEAHDQQVYIDSIKSESGLMYSQLSSQGYQQAKGVRKILRLINKLVKFMASKPAEVELLLQFCKDYLDYVSLRTSYKPLRQILLRQLTKLKTAIKKLDEDLQFDYLQDYNTLVIDADKRTSWVYKSDFLSK